MQRSPALDEATQSAGLTNEIRPARGPGQFLMGVFETFERANLPYCVTHGYEGYPERIGSDVDFIISAAVPPRRLAALLDANRAIIGAEIVRRMDRAFLLAGANSDRSPCFLTLDLCAHCEVENLQFYAGSEVLESRRRHNQFWIPAVDLEFGCYLVRKVIKGHLNDEHGGKLSRLYQHDAAGCRQQVARFWSADSAALIVAAAECGNWEPVRHCLATLRAELRRQVTPHGHWPLLADRVRRGWRPDGLNLVFLGPDGAGKSTVIRAVAERWAGAFARTTYYGFAPGLLHRLLRRPFLPNPQPHAAPPRSLPASVIRAVGYWFVNATLGYLVTVRLDLARSRLVLHDRHFVDALVDPRRYRYAGPSWLLRLIWRLAPKPDLVLLLDAPPEVLRARKQEVPIEESARQREAYRSLVRTMAFGNIIDATQPLEKVVGDVSDIILRHLAARNARRDISRLSVFNRRKPAAASKV